MSLQILQKRPSVLFSSIAWTSTIKSRSNTPTSASPKSLASLATCGSTWTPSWKNDTSKSTNSIARRPKRNGNATSWCTVGRRSRAEARRCGGQWLNCVKFLIDIDCLQSIIIFINSRCKRWGLSCMIASIITLQQPKSKTPSSKSPKCSKKNKVSSLIPPTPSPSTDNLTPGEISIT